MSYDPKADCANSNNGVKTPAGIKAGATHALTCTRCKRETYATADRDGYSSVWTHLRPGKTLADRR